MKVFRLEPCWSADGNSKFASLNNQRRDSALLAQLGKGAKASGWRQLRLFVQNPGKPVADFLWIGSEFACSERARNLVGSSIDKDGEWLPVTIEGIEGTFHIFNATTVIDILSPEQSVWEFHKETGLNKIAIPAFDGERINQHSVCKYPNYGLVGLHVVERSGDFRDGEFKALVERHGLTGLNFVLLWSDTEGPAIPKRIWGPDDPFEFQRQDGTPWVFPKSKLPSKKPVTKLVKTARPAANKQKRRSK